MALRLRLKFHSGILRKSQRSDGLKRSWILVNPQHETISEVASHLLQTFNLYNSCPNGVLLYMDGFVLPPFASTNILKDKDLICVKRKEAMVDAIQECRKETAYLEYNVPEKQTLKECLQLLPNEELAKEIEICECENMEIGENKDADVLHDENQLKEDLSVKKRKSSKGHKSPKRKRQRLEDEKEHHGSYLQNGVSSNELSKSKQDHTAEAEGRKRQHQTLHDNDEQEKLKENHGACFQNGGPSKKLSKTKKDHGPKVDGRKMQLKVLHDSDEQENQKPKQFCTAEADVDHKANAVSNTLDDFGDGTVTPGVPNRTKQSRSSRRKKARRKWRTAEREQLLKKQSLEGDSNPDLGNKKDKNLDSDSNLQQPDELKDRNLDTGNGDIQLHEDSDSEKETVPVVVRPGHIRFAARGKEEDSEHDIEQEELFSWSGTTIKKKGQKWGRENIKWNENRAENQSSDECRSPKQHDTVTPCTQESNGPSMDYENLLPLTATPTEGDIIAYRLVELSSSFCPELTPYRVGKVSWFNPESQRVLMVPVREYPFDLRTNPDDDDTSEEVITSYSEDGTLEIEFQSLVDVRIVKHSEVRPTASLDKGNGGAKLGKKTEEQSVTINENGVKNNSSGPENGAKDAWEDISAALSAKKAELVNKRPFWPHRAMRRSAMGPTLALLRAQNNCQTE